MTRTLLGCAATAALLLALGTASFAAQAPQPVPQPAAQASEPQKQADRTTPPVVGELVMIDADKKTITVKPAVGDEVTFTYTDTTEVSGQQKNTAGLANAKASQVTVHFTEHADTKAKTATRIIVAAAKKPQQ